MWRCRFPFQHCVDYTSADLMETHIEIDFCRSLAVVSMMQFSKWNKESVTSNSHPRQGASFDARMINSSEPLLGLSQHYPWGCRDARIFCQKSTLFLVADNLWILLRSKKYGESLCIQWAQTLGIFFASDRNSWYFHDIVASKKNFSIFPGGNHIFESKSKDFYQWMYFHEAWPNIWIWLYDP